MTDIELRDAFKQLNNLQISRWSRASSGMHHAAYLFVRSYNENDELRVRKLIFQEFKNSVTIHAYEISELCNGTVSADEFTTNEFLKYLVERSLHKYQQQQHERQIYEQNLKAHLKRKASRDDDSDESYRTEEEEDEDEIASAPTAKKQKCNYARCTNVYDPNETTREGETLQWMDCMECDGVFTCCSAHGRREMERFVLAHEGKCTNKK